jgi:hypothetical protein
MRKASYSTCRKTGSMTTPSPAKIQDDQPGFGNERNSLIGCRALGVSSNDFGAVGMLLVAPAAGPGPEGFEHMVAATG